MMRNASSEDFQFIFNLVLAEAENEHFSRELLVPAAARGFEIELKSVLANRVRHNGIQAYALIWEKNSKPIGFVIMSAGSDNKGNELWMSALSPEHRGNGEGKKMVSEILRQFKGKNLALFARCAPESEAMFHILKTNGFTHVATGEQGSRGLMYTL
ncbi:GNAT family N-acetyltransferase [Chromobacterium piscinae]|uniref:GNAT family N-acetyltransferase n=1 Tax=Chromobacterium piscinae TaxID=686831 RepID=UPI003F812320